MTIFHLAFNVTDLNGARAFGGGRLDCIEGRSADTGVNLDSFGHQISLHPGEPFTRRPTGGVGDHMVPMPDFGALLRMEGWRALADGLEAADQDFTVAPVMRFEGQPCEQATMVLLDPFGDPLEFKGMRDLGVAFAT